ncbi:MAG: PIN domain-containing protein [bacterium]|nr:PIN domain-containing protein [bacterium]
MITDARKATYDAEHPVFFDANVWLSLYAPPSGGNDHWAEVYSSVFNCIIANNVPVLMDATVLGEYINRYCRIEFQAYEEYVHPNSKRTFKDFRTQDFETYKPIATDAASRVKEMLEIPTLRRVNGDFVAMDLASMFEEFAEGESDWNDQQIVDLCQRNGCALLTNDGDFKDANIDILTCNGRLLSSKSQSAAHGK